MEHTITHRSLFPELADASRRGFTRHFEFCHVLGLVCDSSPPISYEPWELQIEIQIIERMNCRLYLITCPGGIKGTAIEFID